MGDSPNFATRYGFVWGPAEVARIAELPGGAVILAVRTPHGGVDIRVSPTGRSVRVWDSKSGKELAADD